MKTQKERIVKICGRSLLQAVCLLLLSLVAVVAVPSLGADDGSNQEPTVSIEDFVYFNEATAPDFVYFAVFLSAPATERVRVDYATRNNSARAGADYVAVHGTLFFEPGQEGATIAVRVKQDYVGEGEETFTVRLSNPQGATVASGDGLATITDDEYLFLITEVPNVSEDKRFVQVTTFLDAPSEHEIRASYRTRDGTAKAGRDYQTVSGQLIFAPGQTIKTFRIPIIDDITTENTEEFTLEWTELLSVGNLSIYPPTTTIIISDNDQDTYPFLSVDHIKVREGDSGQKQAVFVVRLSQPTGQTVSVAYDTDPLSETFIDGAKPGLDYIAKRGTLVFPPGHTIKRITVPIIGDRQFESNETFSLNFGYPEYAQGSPHAECEILNDDKRDIFQFSHLEYRVRENQRFAEIALRRIGDNGNEVYLGLDFKDNSAQEGSDYSIFYSGVAVHPRQQQVILSVPAGQQQVFLSVPLLDNDKDQEERDFYVQLRTASNGSLVGQQRLAHVIIEDDDAAPEIILEQGPIITEEEWGGRSIRVHLSATSFKTVQVDYELVSGTATAHVSAYQSKPGDYYYQKGTLTIPAHGESAYVDLSVIRDRRIEPDETFLLKLSNPVNATSKQTSLTIIIRDDEEPITTLKITEAHAPDKMPVGQMFAYGVVVKNTGRYTNYVFVEATLYLNGREINRQMRHVEALRAGEEGEAGFLFASSEKGKISIAFKAYSAYEGPPPAHPNLVTARVNSQIYDLLDITDRLIVYASPLTLEPLEFGRRGVRFRYTGTVTVTCTQSFGAAGPLTLVFGGLPDNVELVNRSGTTTRIPRGRPYIKLDLSQFGPDDTLPFDGSITIPVEFIANFGQKVTFQPRILAGTAHP
jgi:hypothetical protein